MDADTFLDWELGQQEDHELVDGKVVLTPRGRTQANTSIVSNILVALTPWARDRQWKVVSRRLALRTGPEGVIYPSLAITTGKADPMSPEMAAPVIVVEVLEPGHSFAGSADRVDAIKHVSTVGTILLVASGSNTVAVHRRNGEAWSSEVLSGMDSSIPLHDLGMELSFDVIYDGLEMDYASRLERLGGGLTP